MDLCTCVLCGNENKQKQIVPLFGVLEKYIIKKNPSSATAVELTISWCISGLSSGEILVVPAKVYRRTTTAVEA